MNSFMSHACLLGWVALLALVSANAGARDKDAAPDPDNLPPEMTLTLEQLLNDPEGVAPDSEATRCINRRVATETDILDSEHLIFRSGVGNRVWLNRLSPGCLGLRTDMILVTEARGSNMCKLDTVYGVPRTAVGGFRTGQCALGEFEPITAQHADALKESFKLRGKQLAEARKKARREDRAERKRKRREAREARKAKKTLDS